MAQNPDIQTQIAQTVQLLRDKLGVRDKTLTASVRKAKRQLPRRIYKQALLLANAEQMAAHPKLRLVLDTPKLARASEEVQDHLTGINLADRRLGWFLGMLGGLAFNLLALLVLLLVFLRWQGFI
ncbi:MULTISPECIES: hypothetical protein [Ruegeria]|uniref:hypothetical protein n=1 Tax=Ruegeria TaxID=97050 RepID=UPI00147C9991|nr:MULTISPECIES: hypothetical protein [Ruegeria]MBO9410167.1 hypothetical protein [Ruegeria sp. R8_1]MBO9414614.1 hypothetical protein [Ruegeria sp. R8_2]